MATETSCRAYHVVEVEHLSNGAIAEIMFGVYPANDDGEVATAEMAFRWYDFDHRTHCRLEIYDESWAAFSRMPDVFSALGGLMAEPDPSRPWRKPASPTVEDVVGKLEGLGFVDIRVRDAQA
jgi:hypothetical protein